MLLDRETIRNLYKANVRSSGGIRSSQGLARLLGDPKNKVCFWWVPRAGSTGVCQAFFDLIGLREDAMQYSNHGFVHTYRNDVYNEVAPHLPLDQLKDEGYTCVKTIVNPYRRAVSAWKMTFRDDISFRDWAKRYAKIGQEGMTESEAFHTHPQFLWWEEEFVTTYIHLDRDESVDINGFEFRPSRHESYHYSQKVDSDEFVGDLRRSQLHVRMPRDYRHFYDDSILADVERIYRDDILNYDYTFDEMCAR